MNEFHSSCESNVHDITSFFGDKLHKGWWLWACLDIVNEFFSFFSWHSISAWSVPKCVRSHHICTNEQGTRIVDLVLLNWKHLSLCIFIRDQLSQVGVAHKLFLMVNGPSFSNSIFVKVKMFWRFVIKAKLGIRPWNLVWSLWCSLTFTKRKMPISNFNLRL